MQLTSMQHTPLLPSSLLPSPAPEPFSALISNGGSDPIKAHSYAFQAGMQLGSSTGYATTALAIAAMTPLSDAGQGAAAVIAAADGRSYGVRLTNFWSGGATTTLSDIDIALGYGGGVKTIDPTLRAVVEGTSTRHFN